VENIPTTIATVLATLVIRLPTEIATASPNLEQGDLFLLMEDNTAPLHWPTAVITDIHTGKDGIVRVVTIRTPKGVLKRVIVKISSLPRVNSELECHCLGVPVCYANFYS